MGLFSKKSETSNDGTQSKSEADLLIEKLTPVIDAAVKPIRDKVEAISTEWDQLKNEGARSVEEERRRAAAAEEENLTPEEKQARENRKTQLLLGLTNARITEEEVVREVAAKWGHLVPKIRECLASIPIQEKIGGDYPIRCRNAVKLIVGDEAMKAGLRYDTNTSKFMIEDAAAASGGEASPLSAPELTWQDPRSGKVLTATEQLAKLKIDPKEFAEAMKAGIQ